MRNLYARFVLWLIRPALRAHAGDRITLGFVNKDFEHEVIEIMLNDARRNGPFSRAVKGGL